MNKQTAKKIAYRRAWLILQSTLESGWDPNEGGSHEYSKVECRKILKEVENICDFLWKKSKGNPEQNLMKHIWEKVERMCLDGKQYD
jgi:hypothetical protein